MIRLTEDGQITAEGPVGAGRATVGRAAMLLDDLLPEQASTPEYRVPGGLRLVLLRAQGTLDLPPFSGLQEFCASLSRFAAPDSTVVVHELLELWRIARHGREQQSHSADEANAAPAPESAGGLPMLAEPIDASLTISDVRRARRATGLSLDEVAERSRIPAALLRELEWGYLRNWPGGLYGRTQLVRYARAAGLDDHLVLQVAWPLLLEAVDVRGSDAAEAVPAEQPIDALLVPEVVVTVEDEPLPLRALQFPTTPARPRRRWTAAFAAAALIAIATLPALWEHAQHSRSAAPEMAATAPQVGSRSESIPQPTSGSVPVPTADAPATTTAPAEPPVQARRNDNQVIDRVTSAPEPVPERVAPEAAAYSPSFSNVGTAMFFREDSAGHSALVRADTDSPGTILKITRVVDDHAQNFHARPSPDGSQLAFDSDREGMRAVFVADADGKHVRRVSGEGFAAVPSWSPDGNQLAFVRAEPDNLRVWNLWLADVHGGELRRLTSYKAGQPWGGSWFPDGRRIAYSHEAELVVMDIEAGTRRVYPTPVTGRLVRTPAVSPDGRKIIFQVYRDGAWLLDLRSGSMRRVLDDPTAEEYTWAPDGHRVAFHSLRAGGWGVWVMGQ